MLNLKIIFALNSDLDKFLGFVTSLAPKIVFFDKTALETIFFLLKRLT